MAKNQLEDRVSVIETDIKQIMNNDLPHMEVQLSSITTNQKWIIGILLLVLAVIIGGGITNILT